jgi:hypothetical protein
MDMVHSEGYDAHDLLVSCRSVVFQAVRYLPGVSTLPHSFYRKQYPDPTLTTKAALGRAAGPSLGTVCFAALVLSVVQSLILILRLARRVRHPIAFTSFSNFRQLTSLSFMPLFLHPLALPISIAQSSLSSVSQFALVYSGLTGDSFVQAAKRSKAVTSIKRPGIARRHCKHRLLLSKIVESLTVLVRRFTLIHVTPNAIARVRCMCSTGCLLIHGSLSSTALSRPTLCIPRGHYRLSSRLVLDKPRFRHSGHVVHVLLS